MNERFLRRLFRHALMASLPLAATVACGGATSSDPTAGAAGAGGSTGGGGSGGEAGGLNPDPCSSILLGPCSRCVSLDAGSIPLDGGAISPADCEKICGSPQDTCSIIRQPDGAPIALSCYHPSPSCSLAAGRRPAGLVTSQEGQDQDTGAWLAAAALLEAASVDAFLVLRDELVHHGAPLSLVRAAERAAEDEVRHARVTAALARRFGASVRSPRVEKQPIRSLDEIAVENAIEGCVRETYGALVATYQARAAKDRIVRAAFARIAEDETRHAALAWKVAAWLDGKLDDEARARVREARRQAAEDLAATARVEPPREWIDDLGIPAAPAAATMADQLKASLWS
jgi:hypothetical protein